MRLLTRPVLLALAFSACIDTSSVSPHLHPQHATSSTPTTELRHVAGTVIATETAVFYGVIRTCAEVADRNGANRACFPGGLVAGRARFVTGFPWLRAGDHVEYQARSSGSEWMVVQNSLRIVSDSVAGATQPGLAR
jgi:hypothetical protein